MCVAWDGSSALGMKMKGVSGRPPSAGLASDSLLLEEEVSSLLAEASSAETFCGGPCAAATASMPMRTRAMVRALRWGWGGGVEFFLKRV